MSEQNKDQYGYPFFWLDEVVGLTLNPARGNLKQIDNDTLNMIRNRLPAEITEITVRLKNQTFSVYQSDQVKVITGHYDLALRILRQQAIINLNQYPKSGLLHQTGQHVLQSLGDLAEVLYQRYKEYLPNKESETDDLPRLLFKLLIRLSGDQIGILIRAAYDSRLIDAPSKRAAYRAIAPYLSTTLMDELSDDSLRSNSGRPEEKDLEVVLKTLDILSKQVRGYY